MRVVLTHAPLDDPTVPYHSNAYLAGHLAKMGHTDVSMLDINVRFVNWCLEAENISRFYQEAERRLAGFEAQKELTFPEQEAYYNLWSSRKFPIEAIVQAREELKVLDQFLNWAKYKVNVNIINSYFAFIGALSYPGEIFNFRLHCQNRFSIYNNNDLFDEKLSDQICYPLLAYMDEVLRFNETLGSADLIGVSIIYDHQVVFGLGLVKFLKKTWPDKLIVIGGTSLSSFYKNLKNPEIFKKILNYCDGVVVGEGESALCEIIESGGDFQNHTVRNLIYVDKTTSELVTPKGIFFENVSTLGRPIYQYEWDLYLSPERIINYSPTRGCYWNRCTFCDYGLNVDKPTSPWRERKIETVIEDLKAACDHEKVSYVYFAVDVMAPGYIERLAEAVIEAGLKIKWAAEMRMEKVFSPKRVGRLAESGAVCISFGMESGNQRILDLIDKGTKVEFMGETMKNFSEAGIAVQLMAFTHFPGELESERFETIDFITANKAYWATGGLARFVLTGKAIVARNPSKFGIKILETLDVDTDVNVAYIIEEPSESNELDFLEGAAPGKDKTSAVFKSTFQESEETKRDVPANLLPKTFARPWAGATDTLHTMIYYNAYDRDFFKNNADISQIEPCQDREVCKIAIPGFHNGSRVPIDQILKNRSAFRDFVNALRDEPREPTIQQFRKWTDLCPKVQTMDKPDNWLAYDDKLLRIDRLVSNIIKLSVEKDLPPALVADALGEEKAKKVVGYLYDLAKIRLIELYNPATHHPNFYELASEPESRVY